ncbi:MAG: hypothetical protein ACLFR1_01145 [Spirochaetia bacterium]
MNNSTAVQADTIFQQKLLIAARQLLVFIACALFFFLAPEVHTQTVIQDNVQINTSNTPAEVPEPISFFSNSLSYPEHSNNLRTFPLQRMSPPVSDISILELPRAAEQESFFTAIGGQLSSEGTVFANAEILYQSGLVSSYFHCNLPFAGIANSYPGTGRAEISFQPFPSRYFIASLYLIGLTAFQSDKGIFTFTQAGARFNDIHTSWITCTAEPNLSFYSSASMPEVLLALLHIPLSAKLEPIPLLFQIDELFYLNSIQEVTPIPGFSIDYLFIDTEKTTLSIGGSFLWSMGFPVLPSAEFSSQISRNYHLTAAFRYFHHPIFIPHRLANTYEISSVPVNSGYEAEIEGTGIFSDTLELVVNLRGLYAPLLSRFSGLQIVQSSCDYFVSTALESIIRPTENIEVLCSGELILPISNTESPGFWGGSRVYYHANFINLFNVCIITLQGSYSAPVPEIPVQDAEMLYEPGLSVSLAFENTGSYQIGASYAISEIDSKSRVRVFITNIF